MLKFIQTEFLKLRRKKLIWLMLLATLIMPFFALLYFKHLGETDVDPIQFYKWSAFSYTIFIILPVVLGMLCTILMREENQYDILKQLLIVPISKMGYFFSKFFVVLIYSICFMLITAIASIIFSILPGYVVFEWGSVLYLLKKCLEFGVIIAFVMLPILAIAVSQKGYILPTCITLVYAFSGFILMTVNMYLHPLSSMAVIVMRNKDIPGLVYTQAINIPLAFLCICIWDIVSIVLVNIALRKRK
ncbi:MULTISPECIES: ABC transporter permease [unclassified Clostridioides]|uniref:ABC transporter permease n=1 Tax=unclassified Clostridioides TaxID=2635829 RepID=UPI001D0CC3BC|nr:ABC transporter permease [Clostridioides sp. ES-S-0001-02]MCC0640143.1 ABC transporter permease [Clostridioides sp. ES-S-0049-03]MCC0652077.1 ABC transporter permease [Clostridioides sp. ES-S-0001-03]MCC0655586.1 ABC transporter permease [Clostridioides sp. ES-S-0123-01]MCC0673266.1 ABC transporter permease [Clostridioides sp. ES-S-0145-01]MCC0674634.1 ABC transporter permease [Clostridioides sp. ES-W-0018-02]MCC0679158.1 ABC transporter permease [Clostridioides sp. ES-S-0005-03]MCC069445